MWLSVVGHLIAHPGLECEPAAILQFGLQLTFQTQQDVSLAAPVIGEIARRVFDHPYSHISEAPLPPVCDAPFPLMFAALDVSPLCHNKRNATHAHAQFLQILCPVE